MLPTESAGTRSEKPARRFSGFARSRRSQSAIAGTTRPAPRTVAHVSRAREPRARRLLAIGLSVRNPGTSGRMRGLANSIRWLQRGCSEPSFRFPSVIAQRLRQEGRTLGPRLPTASRWLQADRSHSSWAQPYALFQSALPRCKIRPARDLRAPTVILLRAHWLRQGLASP